MQLRIRAIAASVTGTLCGSATSAMAQAGVIPDRNGIFYHGHDMMWGSSQWGGFGMVLGPIFMILIVVGIIAGVFYLLRLFGAAGSAVSGHTAQDRAMALLKERYAKGEIDSAEFTDRKTLLAD